MGQCSVVWETVGWGGAGFGVRRVWVVWGGVVIKAHCHSMLKKKSREILH